jgi:multiple antibiotic resistance protein
MLNAQPAESGPATWTRADEKVDAGASIAVVPLTIPLLTGPATISTMVIYAEKTRHLWELGGAGRLRRGHRPGDLAGLQPPSGRIAKVLGRTGINVMTRLMGLILAAMAVELLADGLVKLFPGAGQPHPAERTVLSMNASASP